MHVCPECCHELLEESSQCTVCGLNFASVAAVGAMNTAVQGSADLHASASATQITVGSAASRIGKVFGSYRLLAVLGEGGMGAVYLAEHTRLGRKVALKMLHSHYTDTPEVVRRFFAEAKAVNRIFHDHIVEITDFVESERGPNYFIMEYLKGMPLADLIQREGAMPLARSVGIIVQVCSALSAVHEAGIVHRDLKPDNIFITERGGQKDYVKILDFGIAKLLDAEGKTINLQTTAAGMIMGTPEYMSPEQARGKPVDYRTDIYSVGIILYELAAGRKPFLADTFGEMVVAHSTQIPTPPSKLPDLHQDIPRKLDELILQCLEKEPQKRPQTTKEIEDRLRTIASAHQVQLERFDITSRIISPRSRKWLFAAVAAAAAVAIAIALPLFRSGSSAQAGPSAEATEQSTRAAAAVASDGEAIQTTPSQPVVQPLATEPTKIAITIHSVPEGATVFATGDDEPRGVTPFSIELEQTTGQMTFEVRKDGFESVKQTVSLARDAQLAVVLAPQPDSKSTKRRKPPAGNKPRKSNQIDVSAAPAKPPEEKKKPGYKDGAVMNPFEN